MSLLDGNILDAAEALASRAAELRRRPLAAEKRAASASDFLSSLGQSVRESPALSHALIGGAAGAGLGGVGTALGNLGKEKEDKKSVLGSMLTGGLAGGALGGGVGLARHAFGQVGQGGGGEGLKPGYFTDPATGRRMAVDPAALKADPELASKVRELTDKPGLLAQGVGRLAHNVGTLIPGVGLGVNALAGNSDLNNALPVSSRLLPQLALGDALLHSRLNLGDKIGWGRLSPELSRNPSYLIKGVTEKGEALNMPAHVREAITGGTPNRLEPVPGAAGDYTGAEVLGTRAPSAPPPPPVPRGRLGRIWDAIRGVPGRGGNREESVAKALARTNRKGPGSAPVLEAWHRPEVSELTERQDTAHGSSTTREKQYGNPEPTMVRRDQIQAAMREGYNAAEGGGKGTPNPLFKGLLGERQFASLPVRVGSRVLGYGAIPALEIVGRNLADDTSRENRLRELAQRFARPVE
jgi:hypothetical protein